MKIFYISTYPERNQKHGFTGGVASYTKNLLSSLEKKDHRITVLCNKIHGQYEEYEENGIRIIRCFDKNPFFVNQIIKQVKKEKPDLIHVQQELALFGNVLTAYLLQWLLFFVRKIPTVITIHGVVSLKAVTPRFIYENQKKLPVWLVRTGLKIIFKPLTRWTTRTIVHEAYFKDILIEEYKVPAHKIEVIPHGVEDIPTMPRFEARSKLAIDSNRHVVLFLGYLTGYKGLDLLLNAFSEYIREDPEALLLVGAGIHPKFKDQKNYQKLYDETRYTAETLIPRKNFMWIGFIHEAELTLYLGVANVLIFPYTVQMSASGPMAIAIGSDKPFLASDVFAPTIQEPDMIFSLNEDSLSSRLKSFFESDHSVVEKWIQSTKNERKWSQVGERTLTLYEQIGKSGKRVLLLGSFGQTNLGDDALLQSYLSLLHASANLAELLVNTNDPSLIPAAILTGFPSISWINTYQTALWQWIGILKKNDIVLFGGGTIIKELYRSTGRSKHAVTFRMLVFLFLAKLFGKKCAAFNIGIGSVESSLGKWIAKNILKRLDFVSLRDAPSYRKALELFPAGKEKMHLGCDGVLLNYSSNTDSALPFAHKRESAHNGDAMGFQGELKIGGSLHASSSPQENRSSSQFSIGFNLLHDIPDQYLSGYKETWIRIINTLSPKQQRLVFLPFQNGFNTHNDLAFFTTEILPHCGSPDRIEIISDLNIENIDAVFGSLDVFIGMRLHSLVYAFLHAVPFVAVNYSEKCSYFTDEIGYPHTIDMKDFSEKNVVGKFEEILSRRSRIRRELEQQRLTVLKKAGEQKELHQNILREYGLLYRK